MKKKFQLDEYNPKLFLNHTPTSKNSPLGPQKFKKKTKIKSKSKVIFKEIIENERCSTTWVDFKTIFEPYPDFKNSPLGLQKV